MGLTLTKTLEIYQDSSYENTVKLYVGNIKIADDNGSGVFESSSSIYTVESDSTIDYVTGEVFVNIEQDTSALNVYATYSQGNNLNLLNLVPQKFHESQILIDYLAALGDEIAGVDSEDKLYNVENWLRLIDGLQNLLNPEEVDISYLRNLARLINLDLLPEDSTTETVLRSSVSEAIDWYKAKGTYESIDFLGLNNGVSFNIWDLYTKDYVIFERAEWFSGTSENDNPTDYPASEGYYKSPHFGLEVLLNQVYSPDASISVIYDHLWHYSYWDNIKSWIEKTRPVHTVPEYSLLMEPQCDDDGSITVVAGDIQTEASVIWDAGGKSFDENAESSTYGDPEQSDGSGGTVYGYGPYGGYTTADWTLDEDQDSSGDASILFDASSQDTILLIDQYKLGTGSKGIDLDSSEWDGDLETPVIKGTINPTTDITLFDDRAE